MAELDGDGVPKPAEHSARDVTLDEPPQDVGGVTRSAAARIVLNVAQTLEAWAAIMAAPA